MIHPTPQKARSTSRIDVGAKPTWQLKLSLDFPCLKLQHTHEHKSVLCRRTSRLVFNVFGDPQHIGLMNCQNNRHSYPTHSWDELFVQRWMYLPNYADSMWKINTGLFGTGVFLEDVFSYLIFILLSFRRAPSDAGFSVHTVNQKLQSSSLYSPVTCYRKIWPFHIMFSQECNWYGKKCSTSCCMCDGNQRRSAWTTAGIEKWVDSVFCKDDNSL